MHSYLRHLANFARVVEAGSLKAASDLLGTAPSGLSESIKLLEARYGQILLERHHGGMRPTSEGERVYGHARLIVDELHRVFDDQQDGIRPRACKLSLPGEIAQTLLWKALTELQTTAPHMHLKVFVEDDLVDPNRFGRDFYLRVSSNPSVLSGLRAIWSTQTEAVRLVPRRTGPDPRTLTFIDSSQGAPDAQATRPGSIQVNDAATRLALARQGVGQTGCIRACAQASADGLNLSIEPFEPPVSLTVTLLTPHRRKSGFEGPMVAAMDAMFGGDSYQRPKS